MLLQAKNSISLKNTLFERNLAELGGIWKYLAEFVGGIWQNLGSFIKKKSKIWRIEFFFILNCEIRKSCSEYLYLVQIDKYFIYDWFFFHSCIYLSFCNRKKKLKEDSFSHCYCYGTQTCIQWIFRIFRNILWKHVLYNQFNIINMLKFLKAWIVSNFVFYIVYPQLKKFCIMKCFICQGIFQKSFHRDIYMLGCS